MYLSCFIFSSKALFHVMFALPVAWSCFCSTFTLWASSGTATFETTFAFPWPLKRNSDKGWPYFSVSEWGHKGCIIPVLFSCTAQHQVSPDPDVLTAPHDPQPAALWYEVAAFVVDGRTCTAASVIVWRGTDGCSQHKKEIKKERREWHHCPARGLLHRTHGATTSINSKCSWVCPLKGKSLYFAEQNAFLLKCAVASTSVFISFYSCLINLNRYCPISSSTFKVLKKQDWCCILSLSQCL